MRKFWIVLFMIVMCVAYFFYVREKATAPQETVVAIQVNEKFAEIKKQLESEYPSTPKEVMQVYNELMGYAYCSSMKDTYIDAYVDDLRLLYSKGILENNTKEQQVAALTLERIQKEDAPLIIISSTVEAVIKTQVGDTISDTSAQVEVKHFTNQGNFTRTYTLVKEDGKWKIDKWQNEN